MANYTYTTTSFPGGVHKTLSGTTEDTVVVTNTTSDQRIEVFNRGTSGGFYVGFGGSAITSGADGTVYVPAGTGISFRTAGSPTVRILGNGEAYSVHSIPANAT